MCIRDREIRKDLGSSYQMNRLLQGDVGSGKTIVSLLSIFISPILLAQELTSDITGSVSSSSGSVSGAQVEITYEPTNTTVTRTTDASGRYSAGGLRPGGPYTIKVSAAGLMSDKVTTSLVIGETSRLSFTLQSSSSVDDVIVTAQRISADDGLGFSSTIDAQTIQETPSVTRDIKDLIKLNISPILISVLEPMLKVSPIVFSLSASITKPRQQSST